jgi:hypothetical protein
MSFDEFASRRLEENKAAALDRCLLVEPERPVGEARARIDEKGVVLAEGIERRPGERQQDEARKQQRTA